MQNERHKQPLYLNRSRSALLQDLLEHHQEAGLAEADLQVIRRGKALEYYSKHYGKVYVEKGREFTVKEALAGLGTVEFGRVAMQPGMPQGFGVVGPDETPIFTLPGNPVSAYVGFQLFVRPAIRKLLGHQKDLHQPVVEAVCLDSFTSPAGKRQFARGVVGLAESVGRIEVRPVGGSGSHLMGGLAQANCLISVPEEQTRVEAGEVVSVILLDDDSAGLTANPLH